MGIITPAREDAAPRPRLPYRRGARVSSGSPGPRRLLFRRTARYFSASETHTFAFSVAAQALLSFFPFVVFLLTLSRNVFHAPRLYRGLLTLVAAYLPVSDDVLHPRADILRNLRTIVEHHHGAQLFSLLILFATCTGIFLPLEVALNRIWNVPKNRSYVHNWAVAFVLALGCGVLGIVSASLTALSQGYSRRLAHFLGMHWLHLGSQALVPHDLVQLVSTLLVHIGAVPITIAVFFLIYWQLPNVRVPARVVLPAAVVVGLCWEISKYIYILLLPWLNIREVYGPFALSVSLVLWAYVSALLLLLGAEIVAETRRIGAERTAAAAPAPA